mgnify:FL=1|tara:strand:+ start:621 stop:1196 length:576 start_codon:yes stop_codon:yes gene_type:complete
MKKNILQQTASQTVGPFFAFGLTPKQYGYNFPNVIGRNLRKDGVEGIPISIVGQVLDGNNKPLNDAIIEVWQADPDGNYATETINGLFGFGRSGTGWNDELVFSFETFKPGFNGERDLPHINITVFARGMQNHLFTRLYFPEDKELFYKDEVLSQLDKSLHDRLTAKLVKEGLYRFDISLQGKNETVFLDI